ncbi:MAG: RNA recognition motif domain-containing protein [Bacteroidota bacterium]|jgi:RNA recognition motif-containing protein|nr:RNA-binding protein [Bacteroidota bacterium]
MNIFVGNLNYKMTGESLTELFSPHGQVSSSRIIMDKVSGRSKGFGFVEMPDNEEALKAIAAIHETEVMGRKIIASEARAPQR